MATALKEMAKDLTVDDLRAMIEQTVRNTLEEYLADLRLLIAPPAGQPAEVPADPRPLADRPLKRSMDH
jgi:hypothetical protein